MASALDLKALDVFIQSPVTQDMIHKLVVVTLQVLPCKESKSYPSPPTSPSKEKALPSLMTFISKLVRYTNVYTGTLMASLVYLNRLKNRLPKNAQGLPCTRHRIFLSCLILSAKIHNDSSPNNIHWAKYTDGLFSAKDINLMERQLLYLLNWDLKVTNEEMVAALDSFLGDIKDDIIKSYQVRKFIQKRKIQQKMHQQHYQHQQHSSEGPALHGKEGVHRERSGSCSSTSSTVSDASDSSVSDSPKSHSSSSLDLNHYRQDSASSISSLTSIESLATPGVTIKPQSQNHAIDPSIELTAIREQVELDKMLNSLRQ